MSNKARDIVIPDREGVLRAVFLYAGQGDSTILAVPDGSEYKYVLIDTNKDEKNGGIDVVKFLTDLLDDKQLDVFINTHPHDDHLVGIKDIQEKVGISEIWHSGHKPGKKHDDAYNEMQKVIEEIGKDNEFVLFGTNDLNKVRESDKETEVIKKIGDIDFQVFAPAEYVADDVQGEDQEARYGRIHEHCSVIRFTYGSDTSKNHMLFTGDSDKKAWKDHITEYHKDHLSAKVLSASHHGSRTFFKNDEKDEEVYESHIEKIHPQYVVVSAPKQSESKHGHPHDDAIDIYKKHVDDEDIFHQGENRECVIVDITADGELSVKSDSELAQEYGLGKDEEDSRNSKGHKHIGIVTSQLDRKPMG